MARIVTVYNDWNVKFAPADMGYIRWLAISTALAERGHEVDMAVPPKALNHRWWQRPAPIQMDSGLRRVPLARVRWNDYQVVKTLYHVGFDTLERFGGGDHPFIIAHLGSVVGPEDMEGIYFYGAVRAKLYATQEKVCRKSKYVTVVSAPARDLFDTYCGQTGNVFVVPGAAEQNIPERGRDPFPSNGQRRCIFAGHVYDETSQPEANAVLISKLNELGRKLSQFKIRLYMIGSGDVKRLDPKHVSYLGVVPYRQSWDYFYFADVGTVVAYGAQLHNNETTKVYYYLRAGLPVVSEKGFPNDHVVEQSGLGFTVENGNMTLMAEKIAEAALKDWDREKAVQHAIENHTWYQRTALHDRLIRQHFG
jgi:hypothetical protein